MKNLQPDISFNLADENHFTQFVSDPNYLRTQLESGLYRLVLIDEIQRYPKLLNTIQSLIDENPKLKFLPGCSALKRSLDIISQAARAFPCMRVLHQPLDGSRVKIQAPHKKMKPPCPFII